MSVEEQVDKLLASTKQVVVNPHQRKKLSKRFFIGIGFLAVASLLGTSLVLPLFDRKTLLEYLQTPFQSNSVADPPDPPAYDYEHFVPPENSFGMGETTFKEINKTFYKQWLRDTFHWGLRASVTGDDGTWQDANVLLDIDLNWSDTNCKVTATIDTHDAPRDLYYQLFLGCNKSILQYVEKDGWCFNLTVPANNTEDYSIFFNFSDIKPLHDSGLVEIGKGYRNDNLYFVVNTTSRIAVDKVFVIDPTFGNTDVESSSTPTLRNLIWSLEATPGSDGTATGICVYFTSDFSSKQVTCALYYESNNTFLAATDERETGQGGWDTLLFESPGDEPPKLSSAYTYLVCVWGDDTTPNARYSTTGSNIIHYDSEKYSPPGYNDFPATYVRDLDDESAEFSIYCNYTESGGGANNAPTFSGQYPQNGSTSVPLNPTCAVVCTDADAEAMTVTWQSNYTGSYVTYQNNLSVATTTNVTWDATGKFNTASTTYYWKVFANDGTDNSSEWYYFTTAANVSRSWNKLPTFTCNFSFGNTSIPRTWQSLPTFTCNFSFGNTSIPRTWRSIPSMTCNFSFGNTSIPREWQTMTTMACNFSFGNTTIPRTWRSIPSMTCNFSFGNTSIPRTWQSLPTFTCNFSFGNTSTSIPRTWRSIPSMTCNFSFGNTSIPREWQTMTTMACNFSFGNTTIPRTWRSIPSMTCNFSFGNTSIPRTWQSLPTFTCNFSFGNTSIPRTWSKIHGMTANFSFGNTSVRGWNLMPGLLCNFSFGNTSIAGPTINISISSEYPENVSNIQALQPTIYFTINNSDGGTMNYTVYIDNTTEVKSENGVSNGTYYFTNHYTASNYQETYYWRVVVTSYTNTINETYEFTPIHAGGGGITTDSTAMAVAASALLIAMAAIVIKTKRRKK